MPSFSLPSCGDAGAKRPREDGPAEGGASAGGGDALVTLRADEVPRLRCLSMGCGQPAAGRSSECPAMEALGALLFADERRQPATVAARPVGAVTVGTPIRHSYASEAHLYSSRDIGAAHGTGLVGGILIAANRGVSAEQSASEDGDEEATGVPQQGTAPSDDVPFVVPTGWTPPAPAFAPAALVSSSSQCHEHELCCDGDKGALPFAIRVREGMPSTEVMQLLRVASSANKRLVLMGLPSEGGRGGGGSTPSPSASRVIGIELEYTNQL